MQVFDICPMGLAFAPMSPAHLWVVGMPAVVTHALAARLVPEGGVPAGTAVAMGLVPTQQCLALRSHRGQQEVRSFSEYFPEQIMQLTSPEYLDMVFTAYLDVVFMYVWIWCLYIIWIWYLWFISTLVLLCGVCGLYPGYQGGFWSSEEEEGLP